MKYLLKSYCWEKLTFSKLRFSKFEKFSFKIQNFLLQLKNRRSGSKTVCGFSIILFWKGIMTFESQSPCILLNKNRHFNENKTESKMPNPHTVLEGRTLCFSSCKNLKLKVKQWRVGARERIKEVIICTVYFVQRKFFQHNCFISTHSVLNTLAEYTFFTYQKAILLILRYTFFTKTFSVSLTYMPYWYTYY